MGPHLSLEMSLIIPFFPSSYTFEASDEVTYMKSTKKGLHVGLLLVILPVKWNWKQVR